MKQILLSLTFILCLNGISTAQDIIHTYDSVPIKAKILEIGDEYMKYKTWDNPDGPLYNISLSRVARIIFENGTTKTFAPVSPFVNSHLYPHGPHPLDYRWGHYYNTCGRISRGDLADYIGYSLYGSEYMKASNQYQWGFYLTWAGAAGLILSIAAHIGYSNMDHFASQHGMTNPGTGAGLAVGYIASAGCIGAGIPLWVKGNKGLKKIADDYNKTYINPERNGSQSNLSFGSTSSGVGLALNF